MEHVLLVAVDLALLLGLTLRVVRLVVFDDVGRWWLRTPLEAWAIRKEGAGPAGQEIVDLDADPNSKYHPRSAMGKRWEWPSLYDDAVFARGGMIDNEWVPTFTAALAFKHDQDRVTDPHGWRSKVVSGLDCPWCVGFWISGLMLATLLLAGGPGEAHWAWRAVSGWWALNYVAAHLGQRLGDTG